jgi:hypothetical protein
MVSSSDSVKIGGALAAAFDRTVYDSLSVALAVEGKALLVTVDEYRSRRSSSGGVKTLPS